MVHDCICKLYIFCIPILCYLITISLPYPHFTPCITHSELTKPSPPWNLVVQRKAETKKRKDPENYMCFERKKEIRVCAVPWPPTPCILFTYCFRQFHRYPGAC